MDEAGALLGHQYYLDGTVVRGDERGRTIGFPTANLCTENELLPPHGVYATTTRIAGIVHASVTNIGTRPTVDTSGRTVIETHIFDLNRDLTASRSASASCSGCATSARSSRWTSRAQIAADCQRARVLFTHLSL